MNDPNLKEIIKLMLKKDSLLTHVEIAKQLKRDKAKVSGYLEAMLDYGDIEMKQVGNAKVYYLASPS